MVPKQILYAIPPRHLTYIGYTVGRYLFGRMNQAWFQGTRPPPHGCPVLAYWDEPEYDFQVVVYFRGDHWFHEMTQQHLPRPKRWRHIPPL